MTSRSGSQQNLDILVVEDSHTQAFKLKFLLEENQYHVSIAYNGIEALKHLETNMPALVISDIVMPKMNGYELCRRIKSDDKLKYIPVLLLTTLSEPEDIIKGLESGADNFVTKPYNNTLISRIKYILMNQIIRSVNKTDLGVEIYFSGIKYVISANRIQILDLLLASYEDALWQKRELEKAHQELKKVTQGLESANRMLERLSLIDAITGIANRRYFDSYLDIEWKDSIRISEPISLLMINIDKFKLYNDTYGHKAGEQCIRQLAAALGKPIRRPRDFVARYDDEEFAVILPRTSFEGATVLSHAICDSIASLLLPHICNEIGSRFSISIGAATIFPKEGISHLLLIEWANKLLYQAKQNGKNRIEAKLIEA